MADFKVDLTEDEQLKYDETYKAITANYSKRDLIILDEDPIAKHYLKHLILKYVFTNELPTNTDIQNNIHLFDEEQLTQHYDATIPLQEKPEQIVLERTEDEIKAAYKDKMKLLREERMAK